MKVEFVVRAKLPDGLSGYHHIALLDAVIDEMSVLELREWAKTSPRAEHVTEALKHRHL